MTSRTQSNPVGASTPEALEPAFAAAVATGDLDAIVGLYAADAVVSLPRGREAAGSTAIREAFAAALAAGVLSTDAPRAAEPAGGDAAAPTVRVVVSGDLAMTTSSGADGRVWTQVARRTGEGAGSGSGTAPGCARPTPASPQPCATSSWRSFAP